jgi:hypothetical protein
MFSGLPPKSGLSICAFVKAISIRRAPPAMPVRRHGRRVTTADDVGAIAAEQGFTGDEQASPARDAAHASGARRRAAARSPGSIA